MNNTGQEEEGGQSAPQGSDAFREASGRMGRQENFSQSGRGFFAKEIKRAGASRVISRRGGTIWVDCSKETGQGTGTRQWEKGKVELDPTKSCLEGTSTKKPGGREAWEI